MLLVDGRNRKVEYLRLSVTDRCNLRCFYCMPEEGVQKLRHEDILTDAEIVRIVRLLMAGGIRTVRVTGGEPLLRHGLTGLIESLAALGVRDLAMTTNGTLLASRAAELARAGLHRVNISIDSLKNEKFREIARAGDLNTVIEGIDAAFEAGLEPVKVNVVVLPGVNDDELPDFIDMAMKRAVHVRFIEHMPAFDKSVSPVSFDLATRFFEILGGSAVSAAVAGSGPSENFTVPGMVGSVGLIGAVSRCFCDRCNRVRVYANGDMSSCLFGHSFLDLKGLMRSGAQDLELRARIDAILADKPIGHNGVFGRTRPMSTIGG